MRSVLFSDTQNSSFDYDSMYNFVVNRPKYSKIRVS